MRKPRLVLIIRIQIDFVKFYIELDLWKYRELIIEKISFDTDEHFVRRRVVASLHRFCDV